MCVNRTGKPLSSACPVAEALQASGPVEGDSKKLCLWLESQGPGRITPLQVDPVSPEGHEIGSPASSALPSHHSLPVGLAQFLVTSLPAPFRSLYFPNPRTVLWHLLLPTRMLPSPNLHLQEVFCDCSGPALPQFPPHSSSVSLSCLSALFIHSSFICSLILQILLELPGRIQTLGWALGLWR